MAEGNGRDFPYLPPVTKHGPINDPPDRFAHLTEEQREWLCELTEDKRTALDALVKFTYQTDLEEIKEALHFVKSLGTVGKFAKWAFLTFVGMFVAGTQLWESLEKWWQMLTRGGAR